MSPSLRAVRADGQREQLRAQLRLAALGQVTAVRQRALVRLDGGPQLVDAARRVATVSTTTGRRSGSASESTCASSARVRSIAGWSALLTTITSGISITPALSAWIESPEPGISTSATVSASAATSTSLCPTPTVS